MGGEDVEDASAHRELAAALDESTRAYAAAARSSTTCSSGTSCPAASDTGRSSPRPLAIGCSTARTGGPTTASRPCVVSSASGVREPAQDESRWPNGVAAGGSAARAAGSPGREETDGVRAERRRERRWEVLGLAPVAVTARTGARQRPGREGGEDRVAGAGRCRGRDLGGGNGQSINEPHGAGRAAAGSVGRTTTAFLRAYGQRLTPRAHGSGLQAPRGRRRTAPRTARPRRSAPYASARRRGRVPRKYGRSSTSSSVVRITRDERPNDPKTARAQESPRVVFKSDRAIPAPRRQARSRVSDRRRGVSTRRRQEGRSAMGTSMSPCRRSAASTIGSLAVLATVGVAVAGSAVARPVAASRGPGVDDDPVDLGRRLRCPDQPGKARLRRHVEAGRHPGLRGHALHRPEGLPRRDHVHRLPARPVRPPGPLLRQGQRLGRRWPGHDDRRLPGEPADAETFSTPARRSPRVSTRPSSPSSAPRAPRAAARRGPSTASRRLGCRHPQAGAGPARAVQGPSHAHPHATAPPR